MDTRKTFLAAGALAVAALPAAARTTADSVPGNPAVSCRVAGMSGGGENTQIRYTSDCQPMHSLNVVRKGPLGVPRVYGENRATIYGGGDVVGWEGGEEGGPVYRRGLSAPGAPAN